MFCVFSKTSADIKSNTKGYNRLKVTLGDHICELLFQFPRCNPGKTDITWRILNGSLSIHSTPVAKSCQLLYLPISTIEALL
ncbi:hypothetical protein K7X08_002949 [Anisodus acutangulus]|uniref:Uncharacterized protein n=1 Tax=Anisodus acutangulus TaxID=402998 RepID=A0A9Q1RHS9_9SOLA|nr:hypothetical protein K7X08_002949 [Anisodus acutangulus]